MKKSDFKKGKEEVQEFLKFRKHGFVVLNKRGKDSYKRKEKHNESY